MNKGIHKTALEDSGRMDRFTWICLAGILLLALLLRISPLPGVTRGSLEFGEGRLMANASVPFPQIIQEILPEEAPLKYYFLHLMLYAGRSEFLLRFPALFFDLASILALFVLGRLLFGRKAALLASFFMAISLWNIQHSALARNYTLYVFSALVMVYFFYRATQSSRIRTWMSFGAAAAFSFYAFYPSVFILGALLTWFFLCCEHRKTLIKRLTLSLGLFAIGIMPLVAQLPKAYARKVDFGTGHWGLHGYGIWTAIRDHLGGIAGPFAPGVVVFLLAFFWLFYFQKKKVQSLLLLLLVLIPIGCYVFCTYVFHISIAVRHFFPTYPYVLLMASAGIVSFSSRFGRFAGSGVFLLPMLIYGSSLAGWGTERLIPQDYRKHYADYEGAVSLIRENRQAFDFVVVDPWPPLFSLQYYLDKDNKSPVLIGEDIQEKGQLYTAYTGSELKLYGVADNLSLLKQLAAAGRVLFIDGSWIIRIKDRYKDGEAVLVWLQEHAYRIEHKYALDFYYLGPPSQSPQGRILSSVPAWERFEKRLQPRRKILYPFNLLTASVHASKSGFLKADGTVIRDENGRGKEVLLRGVNLGSLFLLEPWMLGTGDVDVPPVEDEWAVRDVLTERFGREKCQQWFDRFYEAFVQEEDLDRLRSLGVNFIRLPVSYRLLQNEDGSWVTDTAGQIDFSRIDRVVRGCSARGMYVLLDLHGAPGSQNNERHSGRAKFNKLFEDSPEGENYRRRTLEIWEALARHYKDDPMICGYDLLNEPSEPKDPAARKRLWRFYDRLYRAIRRIDTDHMISMEAVWDWDSLPRPVDLGWENVIYQFHYYHALTRIDLQAKKDFMDQKIREGRRMQQLCQVPVLIGEFSCVKDAPAWEYYLGRLNREKWSWAVWPYKSYPKPYDWGLCRFSGRREDLPRFRTDSFEELLRKVPLFSTARYYAPNAELSELVKKFASQDRS